MLRGNIASSFIQLLVDWLAEQGEQPQAWLGISQPPAGELSRIDVNDWQSMLQRVSSGLGKPELGLLIGSRFGLREAGLLGYMASCCATMAEACLRLSQFEHLVYNVNPLKIVTDASHVTLQWGVDNGRPGPLVDECAIAGLVAFCKSLGGDQVTPDYVCFVNSAPVDVQPYERFFGCTVEFHQALSIIRYPMAAMASPIATANATLREALDHKARSLLVRLPTQGEPVPGLYRALQDAIAAGTPALESVAERLLTSGRSLQRSLQGAGTGFQKELDKVRLALAQQHLKEGSATVQEIAWMLAYNDHSAFVHAFRRMTGMPPQAWRSQDTSVFQST